MNQKAISGIVATSLIIVVAVLAIVGFQTWFSDYSSQTFSNVEQKSLYNSNIEILDLTDNYLYLKSDKSFIFEKINIYQDGNLICNISQNENLSILAYWSFDKYNETYLNQDIGDLGLGRIKSYYKEKVQAGSNESLILVNAHDGLMDYLVNVKDFFYRNYTFEITSGAAMGEKRRIVEFEVNSTLSSTDRYPKKIFLDTPINNLVVGDEFRIYYNNTDSNIFTQGKFGNCLKFDGYDDLVTYENSNSKLNMNFGERISISYWFKAPIQSYGKSIIYKNSGCIGYSTGILNTGKINFNLITGVDCNDYSGYSLNSAYSYDDDNWHYVVINIDRINNFIEIYIDKNLEDSKAIDDRNSDRGILKFGNTWDGSQPLNGSIDEVIFFNQTLNQEQINKLYESSLSQKSGVSSVDISKCNLNKNNVYEVLLISNKEIVEKEFFY